MIDFKLASVNLMGQLKERMVGIYGDYYFNVYDRDPADINRFSGIAKNVVGRSILGGMYRDILATDPTFLPLEQLSPEQKGFYWETSKGFFDEKEKRMQACKAMYVMDWIAGTFETQ